MLNVTYKLLHAEPLTNSFVFSLWKYTFSYANKSFQLFVDLLQASIQIIAPPFLRMQKYPTYISLESTLNFLFLWKKICFSCSYPVRTRFKLLLLLYWVLVHFPSFYVLVPSSLLARTFLVACTYIYAHVNL